MKNPYDDYRTFSRERDAIALWGERICAALFVIFLLANAAGVFE